MCIRDRYHTMNCGFRQRISGETDFPCISGERVGMGRSYVKLDGRLDYDQWCEGIRQGRCYVSEGKSHLINFTASNVPQPKEGASITTVAVGERSSWVALRILPSSHTNPIFVLVDGKPIRASRRSAEWCLKGVDQCWSQKERFIKPAELDEAKRAYAHAREAYKKILAECDID